MMNRFESLTADQWWTWLKRAKEGDFVVYHRGFLGADVSEFSIAEYHKDMPRQQRADLSARANMIRTLTQWSAGLYAGMMRDGNDWYDKRLRRRIDLYQIRLAPADYLYIARARAHAGIGLEDGK